MQLNWGPRYKGWIAQSHCPTAQIQMIVILPKVFERLPVSIICIISIKLIHVSPIIHIIHVSPIIHISPDYPY